jgi:hypothetical protein
MPVVAPRRSERVAPTARPASVVGPGQHRHPAHDHRAVREAGLDVVSEVALEAVHLEGGEELPVGKLAQSRFLAADADEGLQCSRTRGRCSRTGSASPRRSPSRGSRTVRRGSLCASRRRLRSRTLPDVPSTGTRMRRGDRRELAAAPRRNPGRSGGEAEAPTRGGSCRGPRDARERSARRPAPARLPGRTRGRAQPACRLSRRRAGGLVA